VNDFLVVYLVSIDKRLLDSMTRTTGCTALRLPSQGDPGVVHLLSIVIYPHRGHPRVARTPPRSLQEKASVIAVIT